MIDLKFRYLKETPSMVRLKLSRDQAVVGVNFERLVDTEAFVKKKKRHACGLCEACQRTDNCGGCRSCSKAENTGTSGRLCIARRCQNLIPQYELKNGQVCDLVSTNDVESMSQ